MNDTIEKKSKTLVYYLKKVINYLKVFIPFMLIWYLLSEIYHIYDKSFSNKTLYENKVTISREAAKLSKTINMVDSLTLSKIFDTLSQKDSKYYYMFYNNANGRKAIIDTTYILKSIKSFSDRIYQDIDWGRDKKVELSESDLANITKG